MNVKELLNFCKIKKESDDEKSNSYTDLDITGPKRVIAIQIYE